MDDRFDAERGMPHGRDLCNHSLGDPMISVVQPENPMREVGPDE